jgi:hypothetical protein
VVLGFLVFSDNIILPVPAPGAVKLKLFCDDFSDPVEVDVTITLKALAIPAQGSSQPWDHEVLNKSSQPCKGLRKLRPTHGRDRARLNNHRNPFQGCENSLLMSLTQG